MALPHAANSECDSCRNRVRKLKASVRELKKRVNELEHGRRETILKFKSQKLEFKNIQFQLMELRQLCSRGDNSFRQDYGWDNNYEFQNNWHDEQDGFLPAEEQMDTNNGGDDNGNGACIKDVRHSTLPNSESSNHTEENETSVKVKKKSKKQKKNKDEVNEVIVKENCDVAVAVPKKLTSNTSFISTSNNGYSTNGSNGKPTSKSYANLTRIESYGVAGQDVEKVSVKKSKKPSKKKYRKDKTDQALEVLGTIPCPSSSEKNVKEKELCSRGYGKARTVEQVSNVHNFKAKETSQNRINHVERVEPLPTTPTSDSDADSDETVLFRSYLRRRKSPSLLPLKDDIVEKNSQCDDDDFCLPSQHQAKKKKDGLSNRYRPPKKDGSIKSSSISASLSDTSASATTDPKQTPRKMKEASTTSTSTRLPSRMDGKCSETRNTSELAQNSAVSAPSKACGTPTSTPSIDADLTNNNVRPLEKINFSSFDDKQTYKSDARLHTIKEIDKQLPGMVSLNLDNNSARNIEREPTPIENNVVTNEGVSVSVDSSTKEGKLSKEDVLQMSLPNRGTDMIQDTLDKQCNNHNAPLPKKRQRYIPLSDEEYSSSDSDSSSSSSQLLESRKSRESKSKNVNNANAPSSSTIVLVKGALPQAVYECPVCHDIYSTETELVSHQRRSQHKKEAKVNTVQPKMVAGKLVNKTVRTPGRPLRSNSRSLQQGGNDSASRPVKKLSKVP